MRRSRLNPVSAKRKSERAERERVLRAVRFRDGFTCTARLLVPDVDCAGPLDSHEVIPRSAWRAGYLEPDNVRLVCRAHHRWIDHHPTDAAALGLHGYSWEREQG